MNGNQISNQISNLAFSGYTMFLAGPDETVFTVCSGSKSNYLPKFSISFSGIETLNFLLCNKSEKGAYSPKVCDLAE